MRSPRAMPAWGKIWHQFIWEAFNQSSWCQPLPLPQLPNDLVPPILKLFWVLQCGLACLWHPSLKFLRFEAFPVFPIACYILKICCYLLFCHLFSLSLWVYIIIFPFLSWYWNFAGSGDICIRFIYSIYWSDDFHFFIWFISPSLLLQLLLLRLLFLLLGQKELLWVFGSNFISK